VPICESLYSFLATCGALESDTSKIANFKTFVSLDGFVCVEKRKTIAKTHEKKRGDLEM
jgi:hypothetical protein